MTRFGEELMEVIRGLRGCPGFVWVVTCSLALGIGAATLFFALVNAVFYVPLPYRESRQLIRFATAPALAPSWRPGVSFKQFGLLRQGRSVLEIGAAVPASMLVSTAGRGDYVAGAFASSGMFAVLATAPMLGRVVRTEDEFRGARPIVVLGYQVWRSRFGADSLVLGRSVRIDDVDREVVGVMPPRFDYPNARLWVPLDHDVITSRHEDACCVLAIARLRPQASPAQAHAELAGLASSLRQDGQAAIRSRLRADPLRHFYLYESLRRIRMTGLVLFGFVLMMTVANVAVIWLARSTGRRREVAIRSALGASPARILRHNVYEGVVLSCVGGGAGVAICLAMIRLVQRRLGEDLPSWVQLTLDWRVLAVALLLSLVIGIILGASGGSVSHVTELHPLVSGAGQSLTPTRAARRVQGALVALQVSLAVSLLIGTGVFAARVVRDQKLDLGFEPRDLVIVQVTRSRTADPASDSLSARILGSQLLARAREIRGVRSAAVVQLVPVMSSGALEVESAGRPEPSLDYREAPRVGYVTSGLTHSLRVRLLMGRDISEDEERRSAPVALINEAAARTLLAGTPLGRRLRVPVFGSSEWITVVGVVADTRGLPTLQSTPVPEVYSPAITPSTRSFSILVRTEPGSGAVASGLSDELSLVASGHAVVQARPVDAQLRTERARTRLPLLVCMPLAVAALLLAVIGVQGVANYTVALRTREIGIRRALGAGHLHIAGVSLGHLAQTLLVGAIMGVGLGAAFGRVFNGIFVGLGEPGADTVLLALLLVISAAGLGCARPILRAFRVAPLVTLRDD